MAIAVLLRLRHGAGRHRRTGAVRRADRERARRRRLLGLPPRRCGHGGRRGGRVFLGVEAAGRELEEIAKPLSAEDGPAAAGLAGDGARRTAAPRSGRRRPRAAASESEGDDHGRRRTAPGGASGPAARRRQRLAPRCRAAPPATATRRAGRWIARSSACTRCCATAASCAATRWPRPWTPGRGGRAGPPGGARGAAPAGRSAPRAAGATDRLPCRPAGVTRPRPPARVPARARRRSGRPAGSTRSRASSRSSTRGSRPTARVPERGVVHGQAVRVALAGREHVRVEPGRHRAHQRQEERRRGQEDPQPRAAAAEDRERDERGEGLPRGTPAATARRRSS